MSEEYSAETAIRECYLIWRTVKRLNINKSFVIDFLYEKGALSRYTYVCNCPLCEYDSILTGTRWCYDCPVDWPVLYPDDPSKVPCLMSYFHFGEERLISKMDKPWRGMATGICAMLENQHFELLWDLIETCDLGDQEYEDERSI